MKFSRRISASADPANRSNPFRVALFWAAAAAIVLALLMWPVRRWAEGRYLLIAQAEFSSAMRQDSELLSQQLASRLSLVSGLRAFVETQVEQNGAVIQEEFDTYAAGLSFGTAGILDVALAPGGTHQFVYPLKGNEGVLGYRPEDDSRPNIRADALEAISTRHMVVSLPNELLQGGLGVIARQAVYVGGDYWGLASIVVSLEPVLENLRVSTQRSGKAIALQDDTGQLFYGSETVLDQDPVTQYVLLPNNSWTFSAVPIDGWRSMYHADLDGFTLVLVLVATMITSLVFATVRRQGQLSYLVAQRTRQLADLNEQLQQDLAWQETIDKELERLLQSEHRERLFAETLSDVTLALVSHNELAAVLDEIVSQAHQLLGSKTASIALVTDDSYQIVRAKGYESYPGIEEFLFSYRSGLTDLPVIKQIVESGQPLLIADTELEEGWVHIEETGWIRSFLGVPVRFNDEILGVLQLEKDYPNGFSEEDIGQLLPLANAATIAIENARLHEQARQEIDDRRKAEAALLDSSKRYRTLFQSMVQGVIYQDPDGTVVSANPALEQIFGLTLDQLQGKAPFPKGWMLTDQEGNVLSKESLPIARSHSSGEPLFGIVIGLIIPGEPQTRWVMVSSVPQFRPGESTPYQVFATFTDVTVSLNAAAEREQMINELESRNMELERFAYTISHDLKSPLITIQGFLGYIERDAIAGKIDNVQSDIQRVRSATHKMAALLDDLLELSRIGRVTNPLVPVNLTVLAQEAISMLDGLISRRQVTVTVAPEMPTITGDHARLLEVIQNLVENGIKFMGDQPDPRIAIDYVEEGENVVCRVRDNGIGIAPRHQERIFGLFEQLSPQGEGTGVGLALVRRIVKYHGGRVWVESDGEGKGSCFHVLLPKVSSVQE